MASGLEHPIRVRGAREHNLRSVELELPRGAFTVLVGVSGSGKSSLLFDTLFVEGQRRYVEALAASSRHGAAAFTRPDVDFVEGLPPTVAVDQRRDRASPRATLGTLTEVHDFLRVLFARLGTPHCPSCDAALAQLTPQQIQDEILAAPTGTRVQLGAPLGGAGLPAAERIALARAEGFVRLRVDGQVVDLEEAQPAADGAQLEVIVDRLVVRDRDQLRSRLADSLEIALGTGSGRAFVLLSVPESKDAPVERWFSERLACAACEIDLPPLATALFSHWSPSGACPECQGLGRPGTDGSSGRSVDELCAACAGSRLSPVASAVRYAGRTLPELLASTPAALAAWLAGLAPPAAHAPIFVPVAREVSRRAQLLERVGLSYLTFNRGADTLASGEASRALLANHCGSGLSGVLYCLDEPTAGLHARDTDQLVEVLIELRDAGNTIIACEHDLRVLAKADLIIEVGPGAGREGGAIVFTGVLAGLAQADTVTGRALRGDLVGQRLRPPRTGTLTLRGARGRNLKACDLELPLGQLVGLCGPSGAGKSSLVTGTLEPALRAALGAPAGGDPDCAAALPFDELEGAAQIQRVCRVNPAPPSSSDRSVPATILGIMNPLRELYAATKAARVRGWGKERFGFNTAGGRCEACRGRGARKVELELLPSVQILCEVCGGSRYDRETLEARFRGLSIADVLALTANEAHDLFMRIPRIEPLLATMREVGLGYLTLGQPGATLSSGERQRLRLAAELGKPRSVPGTLFILDEPTLGLHPSDVAALIALFDRLLAAGASVLCIEHNLDLLRAADHLIELGPTGGPEGGHVIASGTPAELRECAGSPTGRYL